MAKKSSEDLSTRGLFEFAIKELEAPVRRGNRLSYAPYPKQESFHKSPKLGRYVAGANRAGKTDAEVMEAIWWCTNTHPYLERPGSWGNGAIQGRFVVVDIVKGVEGIILPKLRRWCASSDLVNGKFEDSWDARTLTFTFRNGSTIQFLTHQMELDKHGGVPLHFVFFDEIPPQNVFNENLQRLNDFKGFWVIAATAVQGAGWTYDLIWEPWENDEEFRGRRVRDFIDCFQLKQSDNPYLEASEEERALYTFGMSEAEREIREDGAFVVKAGLVFPEFKKATHVTRDPIPVGNFRDWLWYTSFDFGWNNPTAVLWHAVAPDGRIYTFSEHYKSMMTTAEHSQIIHNKELEFRKAADIRIGDPAGNQTQMNTGTSVISEFSRYGIYIGTHGIPKDPHIGIDKMTDYFRVREETPWGKNTPMWMVSPDCENFIREISRLRWASYESDKKAYDSNKKEDVHKRDDHAFDSGKYFATLMPDLRSAEIPGKAEHIHLSFSEVISMQQDNANYQSLWDTQEVEDFDRNSEEMAY